MQVLLSTPHFPFDKALEVELHFHGKTFVFRAQTIASVTCQHKKEGMPLHRPLLTKVFVKSVGCI